MNDKVQKGKAIEAKVRLLDRQGRPLSPLALKYVTISLNPGSQIIKTQNSDASPTSDVMFIIKGAELGK